MSKVITSSINSLGSDLDTNMALSSITSEENEHVSSTKSHNGTSNNYYGSLDSKMNELPTPDFKSTYAEDDSDLLQNNTMISKAQNDPTQRSNFVKEVSASDLDTQDDKFQLLSDTLLEMVIDNIVNDSLHVKLQQYAESFVFEDKLKQRLKNATSRLEQKKKSLKNQNKNDDDTDTDEEYLQQNPILKHIPVDTFSKGILEQLDSVYKNYAWKLDWHKLRLSSLKKLYGNIVNETENLPLEIGNSLDSVTLQNILKHPLYSKNENQKPIDKFEFSPFIFSIQNQDLYQDKLKEYQKSYKTPKGRKSTQKTPAASTGRKRGRKRKRSESPPTRDETPVPLPPILQKKPEVFIPTFVLIEENIEETVEEDIVRVNDDGSLDEYQTILSQISKETDLVIIDLAGEKYPYHIHLDRELKEKKRIWRCWNGGSFKDPEEMTPEELKAYEKKFKKTLPKMPEFKVEPESYLFSPVPTHDLRRGNYETMKEKAIAFWEKKRKEDKERQRLAEEEKRNRKQRKRKYGAIYSHYLSDESENDETIGRGRKRRKKNEPRMTYNLRRHSTSQRGRPSLYTYEEEEETLDMDLLMFDEDQNSEPEETPEPIEKWMLLENTGPQMTLKDAYTGRARFLLRYKFLGLTKENEYRRALMSDYYDAYNRSYDYNEE